MDKLDFTKKHNVIQAYHSLDFSDVREKYTDPGTKYAFDVLDGKIIAGYLIKLACFRHLRDLQRQGDDDFSYTYSLKEANHLLTFAKLCPNVDTGEPTELMGWQKFIFCQMFGWRNPLGGKRFDKVVVSVGRGQGKTYLMAILMCYSYMIESLNLMNQDYLVASINYKQTGKLFGYIKTMLKQITTKEPFKSFAKSVDLSIQKDQVIAKKTNNVLRAITHQSGQFDSFHFTTAIYDEIGDIHDDVDVEKITSGQVKVKNKQFIEISTAYPDPNVPFHSEEQTLQTVMERDWDREGDTNLGLIWSQDNLDETFQPETWPKSNPLLYLPDQHDTLLHGLITKRDDSALAGTIDGFQNKNLNVWLQEAKNSFLKLADVEKSTAVFPSIDGHDVYMGFDYSMFSDNTAIAFAYPYQDGDGNVHWHLKQHSFIPWYKAGSIEAKEKQDGVKYRELAKRGFCTITDHPQGLINDDQVYQWMMDFTHDHNLHVIDFGYDAWGATNATKQLENNTDWPLEAIRQRTSELKDPTKFLQEGIVDGRITHDKDPIMEKALINAQIIEDKIGIQVDKAKATYKIDVVDAIIDALYQGMYHFEDYGIANDKSKQVDRMTAEQVKKWFESKESGLME